MTTATWNETELGRWEGSPNISRRENFDYFPTDRGTGIKSLAYEAVIYDVTARYWVKNQAQLNAFWRFYNVTLVMGVEDFLYDNPQTGRAATCTFVSAPHFTPMTDGGIAQASLRLEMRD